MRMRNEVNFFKAYVAAIKLQATTTTIGNRRSQKELIESIVDNLTLVVDRVRRETVHDALGKDMPPTSSPSDASCETEIDVADKQYNVHFEDKFVICDASFLLVEDGDFDISRDEVEKEPEFKCFKFDLELITFVHDEQETLQKKSSAYYEILKDKARLDYWDNCPSYIQINGSDY